MFATAAIPFSNSFIGELVTLYGVFQYSAIWSLVAAFSLVFGAVVMLRMFRQSVLGPANSNTQGFKDLTGVEMLAIYPFVILVFVFGLVYQPIFDITDDTVINLINNLFKPIQ
jgi:NADH-quinone oxidoreductase subunit M